MVTRNLGVSDAFGTSFHCGCHGFSDPRCSDPLPADHRLGYILAEDRFDPAEVGGPGNPFALSFAAHYNNVVHQAPGQLHRAAH